MSEIRSNLESVRVNMKDDVLLVAVTKTHSVSEINEAIDAGVADIGENKVQEILDKYDDVKPVRWHMIGHLQTNKVKYIIDKVYLIHSLDSMKLAREINKRAQAIKKKMNVLIQVNASHEESKWGIPPGDVKGLIDDVLSECPNVRLRGLMTVAPFADDPGEVRQYFTEVKRLYDEYAKIEHENLNFSYLSMGMTHDYVTAMEEGSNLIRVGTAIFGARVY